MSTNTDEHAEVARVAEMAEMAEIDQLVEPRPANRSDAIGVNETSFIQQREAIWDRYATALKRCAGRSIKHVPASELFRFASDYRAVTSDLALARTRRYSATLVARLNRLVAGGRIVLYTSEKVGGAARIVHFVGTTFPTEFRKARGEMFASACLFFGATLLSAWFVAHDLGTAAIFLPGHESAAPATKSLHDTNFAFDRDYSSREAIAIITNNIQVSAMAFAGGVTGGLFTVYALLGNGFMLGSLSVLQVQSGFGYDFFATIAPHGVIELTAIMISGGAGFIIARALLAPGHLKRSEAMRLAGRRAGVLLIGVCCLLGIAGTIEGFISPMRISPESRYAVGVITGIPLYWYLFLYRARKLKTDVHAQAS